MHLGNILTCKTEEIRVYKINGIQYVIESEIKPVIIDFGNAYQTDSKRDLDNDFERLSSDLHKSNKEISNNINSLKKYLLLDEMFKGFRSEYK